MGNNYEVTDLFPGQQAAYGNLAGLDGGLTGDDGGAYDDGRTNNIDLKALQDLWEKNLKLKVHEGKQRAYERNR